MIINRQEASQSGRVHEEHDAKTKAIIRAEIKRIQAMTMQDFMSNAIDTLDNIDARYMSAIDDEDLWGAFNHLRENISNEEDANKLNVLETQFIKVKVLLEKKGWEV